jgi:hypothetical protein
MGRNICAQEVVSVLAKGDMSGSPQRGVIGRITRMETKVDIIYIIRLYFSAED